MFVVEYRTISTLGFVHPTRVATLGAHIAASADEAAAHLMRTTQNVEVVRVRYAPNQCDACQETGAVHCSDPANCGGPWTCP